MSKLSADDLSALLYNYSDPNIQSSLPLVGPVRISQSTSIHHGRGLVTTRTVMPGDLLFVIKPQLYAPIDTVYQRWSTKGGRGCRATLEEVAEEVLLGQMRQCLQKGDKKQQLSFMLQLGEEKEDEQKLQEWPLGCCLDATLGRDNLNHDYDYFHNDSDANLLKIIRRNAFGPDYHTYKTIETTWNTVTSGKTHDPYCRVLGLYPLAAMINHSCSVNAVRVFVGEVMMVHACAVIPEGEEILWSYILPNQTYPERSKEISSKYGFQCCCNRCKQEEIAYNQVNNFDLSSLDRLSNCKPDASQFSSTMQEMTDFKEVIERVLVDDKLSNEVRRYMRVDFLNFYINYFNMALSDANTRKTVLALAVQLHLALVSCNNACIAHLSILHMAYELACTIHSESVDDTAKTMPNVRFWTEQLKRAHMVRYGSLGHSLEHVRLVMKHTRLVVRNVNGLSLAQWKFI